MSLKPKEILEKIVPNKEEAISPDDYEPDDETKALEKDTSDETVRSFIKERNMKLNKKIKGKQKEEEKEEPEETEEQPEESEPETKKETKEEEKLMGMATHRIELNVTKENYKTAFETMLSSMEKGYTVGAIIIKEDGIKE